MKIQKNNHNVVNKVHPVKVKLVFYTFLINVLLQEKVKQYKNHNKQKCINSHNYFLFILYRQRQSSTRGRGGRGGRVHTGERGGKRNFSSEGRPPKRDYERRSGTGRGREVSKNGSGARNWGNPNNTKELLDEAKIQNGEIPVAPSTDEENAPQVPIEEGPKTLSLEEYQRLEEEKRNNSSLFGQVETRKVVVPKNLKPLEKKEEVIIPPYEGAAKPKSEKKNKHNKESNKQLVDGELLNFSTRGENDRSYSRGGRGGRGNYHNNGARGGKGGRVQKVDTSGIDFPSLQMLKSINIPLFYDNKHCLRHTVLLNIFLYVVGKGVYYYLKSKIKERKK